MMKLHSRYRQLLVPLMMVPILLMASCGGSDEKPAAVSSAATQQGSAAPDTSDADADADEQVVCNLFSNEEISEATGFQVVKAEGNIMGLPTCEWELSVPDTTTAAGLPMLAIVLLPEPDFRSRVDPLGGSLQDIDGPADELKLHYVGGGDTGSPANATFFALKGNQGFQILSGLDVWTDEETAKSALVDLTAKIFDRI